MEKSLVDRLSSINDRVTDLKINPDKITKKNENKTLEEFIDSKIINIYSRNWNKLEFKLKKKKIEEFIDNDIKNSTINEPYGIKMRSILIRLLRRNKLNKSNDLTYNQELCIIESIKYLEIDEEKKWYIWKDEPIN